MGSTLFQLPSGTRSVGFVNQITCIIFLQRIQRFRNLQFNRMPKYTSIVRNSGGSEVGASQALPTRESDGLENVEAGPFTDGQPGSTEDSSNLFGISPCLSLTLTLTQCALTIQPGSTWIPAYFSKPMQAAKKLNHTPLPHVSPMISVFDSQSPSPSPLIF